MKILITEQQYKLLSEGKDYVYGTYNGQTIEASNEDWEAIPFVYYNNKVYVGYTPDLGYEYKEDGYVDSAGDNDYPNYHSEIMDFYKFVYRDDPNYELELPQRRNTYEYLGRIWVESKIISFWKYPQDVNILKKILTLLAKEIKTIYDFDIDYEDYIVDLNLEPDNNNFISLKDYVKGNDATEDELEQLHLLPSKEKRETPQMQAVRDYDSQMKAEKFKNVPEYQWNYEKTKGIAENKKRNIVITEQQLNLIISEQKKNDQKIFYHGGYDKKLSGKKGIHIGTKLAAMQAVQAMIGVPVKGEWDGTREYGKTLLAGKKTLKKLSKKLDYDPIIYFNAMDDVPEEDYYPEDRKKRATYFSSTKLIPLTVKPVVFKVVITGEMTNTYDTPHSDTMANGLMYRQIEQGNAKSGYYYKNEYEDKGSISAVVPDGLFLKIVK